MDFILHLKLALIGGPVKGTHSVTSPMGAAFAEVEIDTLTGDCHTRVANIFLDLGYSLSPEIDNMGILAPSQATFSDAHCCNRNHFRENQATFGTLQLHVIEGAFIQGLGWVALEELKWGDHAHKWISPGSLYTCGPGCYKIPSMNDVPFKFSISLLKGHPNVKAIHSSKAVGEPPFFLASAVFFAIKDAIIAARAEVGCNEGFPLDNPATPERIRMACLDEFIAPFVSSDSRAKLSVLLLLAVFPYLLIYYWQCTQIMPDCTVFNYYYRLSHA